MIKKAPWQIILAACLVLTWVPTIFPEGKKKIPITELLTSLSGRQLKIDTDFTKREREWVRLWIENMREDSEHWGDGAVTFTAEAIVENKLDKDGPVRVTRHRSTWNGVQPMSEAEVTLRFMCQEEP